ncbi:MAG: uncharacterized protein KVP18_001373 [Porospora cf. gigantea A]|nr:MAG: hypothetical protein KVP18_001373 [Porospora cf. gigantea A]
MVMEYVEHELKVLLETNKPEFSLSERKGLTKQLLEAVKYMHANWVMHRDLKTSNLLYSNTGKLLVCDFGMARKHGEFRIPYSQNVVTTWYRAPEGLLGLKQYDEKIDVWSVGCILGEILLGKPLFNGKNELEVINKIFRLVGTPTPEDFKEMYRSPLITKGIVVVKGPTQSTWRETFLPPTAGHSNPTRSLSSAGIDLLSKLLQPDASKRISAAEALEHEYFTSDRPAPQKTQFMPSVPETNAMLRKHLKTTPGDANRVNADVYLQKLEESRK